MDSLAYEILNNEKNKRERETVRGFILRLLEKADRLEKLEIDLNMGGTV
jgi:hypothetical protein